MRGFVRSSLTRCQSVSANMSAHRTAFPFIPTATPPLGARLHQAADSLVRVLPAPTQSLLNRLAEEGARRQDEIIGWFPSEPEQAAAAFSLAVEAGAIVRVSGDDDAAVTARWAVPTELAYRAMAEASTRGARSRPTD